MIRRKIEELDSYERGCKVQRTAITFISALNYPWCCDDIDNNREYDP